jgi:hypothetical protein
MRSARPTEATSQVQPTNILPIAAILSLVTVELGGSALLSFLTGREGLSDWQEGFFGRHEWLPGRFALLHRVDARVGDRKVELTKQSR